MAVVTDLAAIVARDAEWADYRQDPESVSPSADRRALLALLRPIGNWYATTHGNDLDHDHHCRGAEPCTCGWAEAAPALDAISFIDDALPSPADKTGGPA